MILLKLEEWLKFQINVLSIQEIFVSNIPLCVEYAKILGG